MIMKHCKKCGIPIVYPKTYCDDCQIIVDKWREERRAQFKKDNDRTYNQKRDPKYVRFYNSSDWRILSQKYIQDKSYRCERCGKIATEVHHKRYIQSDDGWERRLDYDNLEALCVRCHNEEHDRFKKKKKRVYG